ncbi:ornithine cyclodeaminase family protein [Pseudorhodoferax sp.]|uniref:ornithine cyclodeaminase family protein n=1 Tax=Pseudorhodoferax sp. TaxID=1993553 RepID=UPI002DD6197A|nr:ornithine cyclodeaminase family protein [Pseudorhodoferax sp.]
MHDTPALWISESDVAALLTMPEAIAALAPALAAEARGEAGSMPKTMLQYNGHSNLHALGGRLQGLVGTKTWAHTEHGTSPLLMLWDAHDGGLRAVVEAFALGNLRTGATSGLATQQLAHPAARRLAIAGTGKQALAQVAAVLAVRPIDQVQVWGRDAAKAAAFAARVRDTLELDAQAAPSFAEAARGADVVTLATRAAEPFASAQHFKPGAHVNAIGAIGPDREEFMQDVFDHASLVCTDQLAAAQKLSREFRRRYEGRDWNEVLTLGSVILQDRRRGAWDDLSLFKAMGMGLSDVALGSAVLERAQARGLGRPIPQPKKAPIQLRARRDPAPAL